MNATCMSDQTSLDQYCDERDLRKVPNYYVRMMKPRVDVSKAFDPFRIDDPSFMDCYEGRSRCFKCGQSRKYFCYTCYLPLEHFKLKTPTVELPFKVDIVKHPKEVAGKSTATHAAVLAPRQVTIHAYPRIPEYRRSGEKVVLVFPGPNSVKIEDLFKSKNTDLSILENVDDRSTNTSLPFDRVVLIDCTWNQVKKIVMDERIRDLTRVEIVSYPTLFWRYQTGKPNSYLATIEALYYFTVTVHNLLYHTNVTLKCAKKNESSEILKNSVTNCDPSRLDSLDTDHTEYIHQNINPLLARESAEVKIVAALNLNEESTSRVSEILADCDTCNDSTEANQCLSCVSPEKSSPTSPQISNDSRCPQGFQSHNVNTIGTMEEVLVNDSTSCPNSSQLDDYYGLFHKECCHQYDNLLFFFKFMFQKIHNIYGFENLRAYK